MTALATWTLFLLSSAVIAILFGPQRGPRFIREAAYLYSRPTSGFQWFGFAIAFSIMVSSQLMALVTVLSYYDSVGPIGAAFLWVEMVAAAAWLGYLVWRYVRPSAPGS